MHLGLPGSRLCMVSCITNSMKGKSSPVSRRETENTVNNFGLFCVWGGHSDLKMSAALSAGLAFN